jgi:RNA polymerase sigma-70 factor (sigma-E family)
MTAAESGGLARRAIRAHGSPPPGAAVADLDAARVAAALYAAHYQSLVRLAVLLVHDSGTAEEVVQDSFAAMHAHWRRLRDRDKTLVYLRRCVVNRSRSVLRHRMVVARLAPQALPDMPSAEQAAIALLERAAVIAALRRLSPRQREALVLRYYADFSDAQIASAMGISRGAVKSHIARAMSALRCAMQRGELPRLGGAELVALMAPGMGERRQCPARPPWAARWHRPSGGSGRTGTWHSKRTGRPRRAPRAPARQHVLRAPAAATVAHPRRNCRWPGSRSTSRWRTSTGRSTTWCRNGWRRPRSRGAGSGCGSRAS